VSLRVCLVIPTLVQGGAEKQLTLLARGLAKHDVEPVVVVLTHSGPREDDLIKAGIQVHHIHKRLKLDPFAWNRLRKLFVNLKPDVVHTWIFAANAYGRSAALAAKVPIILGSERSVDPWKSSVQLWIDRLLARRTSGLTANSKGTIDFYVSKGIPRDQFAFIPNGIEPSTAPAISREEAFSRMGVPLDCKVILSVGRLWHQKGYKDLIWSAELLRVMRGDIRYVIVGEGPERQRLEQYRDNIRGHEFVRLLGERTDVGSLMPHCDALWNGSLYEGQSNVIMEAMQLGLPVIASDIPGNLELVAHGNTGMIFRLGQIEDLTRLTNRLLDNSEQRASLVASAKQYIQNEHSVEGMVHKHVELYRAKVASK
jgi:glycosyltransferase involved in cell wall biosynthesis